MKSEIVRTFTDDGLGLEGWLIEPVREPISGALIHFHGFAGNFYSNSFVNYLAKETTDRGILFLTVNTRGHDSLAEFYQKKAGGMQHTMYGSIHESFEECILDIKAWLDFLSCRGHQSVILQGHSVGALKIAYYQSVEQDERVKALFLISPSDVWGNHVQRSRWQADVQLANQMVENGRGSQFMPDEAFGYPISAQAYLSYCGPKAKSGIFNFYKPDDPFVAIGSIREPIYAVIGNMDETVCNDVLECMSTLERKAIASVLCKTRIIDGASHLYIGKEQELANIVGDWLKTLP